MLTSMTIQTRTTQDESGYCVGFEFCGAFYWDLRIVATMTEARQRAIEIWNIYQSVR